MSMVQQEQRNGALAPELAAAYADQMDALAPAQPSSGASRNALTADAMPVDGVQPLTPTMAWNWRDAVTGTTDRAQYELLDTMPAGPGRRSQYLPSSSRISSVYADIVGLIVEFPIPRRLSEVRSLLERPHSDPADTPNPLGWTKVPDGSGVLRWQPDWSASQTPREWLDDIARNPQDPTALRFVLSDIYGGTPPALPALVAVAGPDPGSERSPLPIDAGELHAVEITAEAWGRVTIHPGQWYDPAIVALRDQTTYRNGLTAASLIGPHGMLRAQATGLLVAADPRVTLTVSDDFVQRNADLLRTTTDVEVAGWVFRAAPSARAAPVVRLAEYDSDASVSRLTASSPTTVPQIAGIYVTAPGE